MKFFLALALGMALGAVGFWVYSTEEGRARAKATEDQISSAAKSATDAVHEKLRVLDLRPQDIKDDLARTGQVVRRTARDAGKVIADATADARVTAMIKAKLVASHDLSALNISVNTTAGIVTLSGTVSTTDDISKAMLLAMDTDGVQEVVSTLQVRPKAAKTPG
jgi:osmotically-inducible protein OsmY